MIRPYKIKDKQNLIDYWLIQYPEKEFSEIAYLVDKIVKKGLICYLIDNSQINGLALIQKKENKHELILISNDYKDTYKLMKYLIWHTNKDLYIHFDKWHSNIKLLKKFGFRFSSSKEDSTFDLVRKFDSKYYFPKKDKDNDYSRRNSSNSRNN